MSWKNIPIYVRRSSEAVATRMGEASADDLQDVLATLREWGYEGDSTDVAGQFIEGGFEAIVMDEN